jgi:hypothetical protein
MTVCEVSSTVESALRVRIVALRSHGRSYGLFKVKIRSLFDIVSLHFVRGLPIIISCMGPVVELRI